jgi:glutamate 5-kinase
MLHRNQSKQNRTGSQLTIVVKVGTTTICDETSHFPLLSNLSRLVETVLELKSLGHRVILVTSAAVGTGLRRLNMSDKPSKLAARQVRKYSVPSFFSFLLFVTYSHYRQLQPLDKVV